MDKQLTFYFGEYDMDRILNTIEEEFKDDIFSDLNLTFVTTLGNEMEPYTTIHIDRMLYSDNNDHPLTSNIGKIELKEDIMYLFDILEGDKALDIIRLKANRIAFKLRSKIWH